MSRVTKTWSPLEDRALAGTFVALPTYNLRPGSRDIATLAAESARLPAVAGRSETAHKLYQLEVHRLVL